MLDVDEAAGKVSLSMKYVNQVRFTRNYSSCYNIYDIATQYVNQVR